MCYLQVHTVLLLYGFSHVHGFFRFRHQDSFIWTDLFLRSDVQDYQTYWFEQPVDHFNQSDRRTWKMKYLKNIDSWKPGGPIMLFLNGESPLPLRRTMSINALPHSGSGKPLIDQIVNETNAAYFLLEHRYYGDIKPLDDLTPESLAFLSSKQALADAALFLETLKNSLDFKNSKVMVVGGSYAGNLAAWMKVVYPNLVDAVLSSSAPVIAKKDFYEYFETTTDTFRTYGSQECVDRISNEFSTYRKLLQSPEGIEMLKEAQNICKEVNMTVPENQQLFFSEKIDNIYAAKAQYQTPNDISKFCNSSDLDNSLAINSFSPLWNDELYCFNFNYNEVIRTVFSGFMMYWFYQTCTEFGYYQSTTSKTQMFGDVLPVDFFYKTCSVLFGEEFNEQRVDQGVTNTNNMYGGLTPNVKNVVFVNGDMDPWHRLGILQDLSADVPAIYIKGSSHCHDLNFSTEDDSDSLKEARIRIKNLMKKWIGAQ